MMNKDIQAVNSLIHGTEKMKIKWNMVPDMNYNSFRENWQRVHTAYDCLTNNSSRRVILYKESTVVTDPNDGEEVEQVSMHLCFTKDLSYKPSFKLSDSDLGNRSHLIWTLYKLAQRSESGADSLIDDIIKEYGEDDDLPF